MLFMDQFLKEIESLYVKNGNCVYSWTNCVSYQNEIGCIKCKSEFFAKNWNCIYPGSQCLSYQNEIGCTKCKSEYYVKNGICVYAGYECLSYKNEVGCTKCISGYYLTGYGESCTPEKNCHYGNKALGICTVCKKIII